MAEQPTRTLDEDGVKAATKAVSDARSWQPLSHRDSAEIAILAYLDVTEKKYKVSRA